MRRPPASASAASGISVITKLLMSECSPDSVQAGVMASAHIKDDPSGVRGSRTPDGAGEMVRARAIGEASRTSRAPSAFGSSRQHIGTFGQAQRGVTERHCVRHVSPKHRARRLQRAEARIKYSRHRK
jgi:hypothetical protein